MTTIRRRRASDGSDLCKLRDSGSSFIELLVAIVLLGTVVVAVLAAVRVTVIASATERDHSRAGQWLESAAKEVEDAPFGNCTVVEGVQRSAFNAQQVYQDAVEAAPIPNGWSAGQITIGPATEIDVWTGSSWLPYTSTTACYDDGALRLQRIRITVTSPSDDVIEQLEVVKRG